jgi:hypothetical protein
MPLKVNLAHHPLHPFGVLVDLCHVLPQDPPGYVLRGGGLRPARGRAAAAQELHEHRGWTTGRMRLAMECRRRWYLAEGGGAMA